MDSYSGIIIEETRNLLANAALKDIVAEASFKPYTFSTWRKNVVEARMGVR